MAHVVGTPDRYVHGIGDGSSSGDTSLQLRREIPNGAINGSNVDFTTNFPFILGTALVFLNGLFESNFIEMSATHIRFEDAPIAGDSIIVVYQIAS